MTPALTWHWDGSVVHLVGRIDENAELDRLAGEIPADGVTIDLAGLTRINSIGVREWMDFVAGLGGRPVRLQRCAPVFVEQLNAIANFSGGAQIASVLAAYECEADGSTSLVEVKTEDARAGRHPIPPRCPECSAETIPAWENDLYYRFLRYAK